MPAKSKAQRNLMKAACANPSYARKLHIDRQTACEFVRDTPAGDKLPARKRKRKK